MSVRVKSARATCRFGWSAAAVEAAYSRTLISMKDVAVIELVAPQGADRLGVPRFIQSGEEPRRPIRLDGTGGFRDRLRRPDRDRHTGPRLKRDTGHPNLPLIFHRGGCFVGFHHDYPQLPSLHAPVITPPSAACRCRASSAPG